MIGLEVAAMLSSGLQRSGFCRLAELAQGGSVTLLSSYSRENTETLK